MPSLREATLDDCDAIASLRRQYGLTTRSREAWEALWRENPTIGESGRSLPIGWVLVNDVGQVIGTISSIPLAYELNGKRLVAATGSGWVVDVPYRAHSHLLIEAYLSQDGADLFLSTTANHISARVLQAYGHHRVPTPWYNDRLVWVLNYPRLAGSMLHRRGWPFGSVLRHPVALGMWVYDALRKRGRIPRTGISLGTPTSFDDRFDAFWQKLRRRANRLLRVRSADHLNWHLRQALGEDRVWIHTAEADAGMVGYAVFVRDAKPTSGLVWAQLADVQTLDAPPEVMPALLLTGIETCRRNGVDLLEVRGFAADTRRAIEEHAPYRRQETADSYFYMAKDDVLAKQLAAPELWDPCPLDGDILL